jgi:hypothetical protein
MRRWSGIAGLVFVVLAFASRAVRGSVPDTDTRDALARFTKFYADSTHNDHALVAIVLGFLGLFAFAWFLGGLWSMLRTAEGGATMPTIIVAVGGAAFIALGMVAHVFSEGVGVTMHFSKGYTIDHGFDPGTALVMASLGAGAFSRVDARGGRGDGRRGSRDPEDADAAGVAGVDRHRHRRILSADHSAADLRRGGAARDLDTGDQRRHGQRRRANDTRPDDLSRT